MPVKRVRFADQTTVHSQPPTNIPPSLPVRFLPLSTGPTTSRPVQYLPLRTPSMSSLSFWTDSGAQLSSSRYAGTTRVHRYFEQSAVNWDLMDPLSMITRNQCTISSRISCVPATDPPSCFITITSPHLPWPIEVRPSRGLYITVDDLFNAIYTSLRTNITKSEFNTLLSRDDQRRAMSAYKWRYRRHRDLEMYETEKRGGMKRVDFLMGDTHFLGISKGFHRPDEWQLDVTWW